MESLFTTISGMMTAYATDIKTVLIALLFIGFICMAFDKLREALSVHLPGNNHDDKNLEHDNKIKKRLI